MVSSPIKYGENFFQKKLSIGGTFLDKFLRCKFECCSLLCRWRRGELVLPGEKPAEEVCLERLGVGENGFWCLAIVVIFMGLGRVKGLGGLGCFKVSFGGEQAIEGGGTNFCVWDES